MTGHDRVTHRLWGVWELLPISTPLYYSHSFVVKLMFSDIGSNTKKTLSTDMKAKQEENGITLNYKAKKTLQKEIFNASMPGRIVFFF